MEVGDGAPGVERRQEGLLRAVTGSTRRWALQGGGFALGVGLGALLGWLAVRGVDWGRVWDSLDGFSLLVLAAAVLVVLLSTYVRAMRWRVLWTTERVSTFRLFIIENAAVGLNNLSPVRALDEPLEFGILALRDRLPAGSIIATMMMSRIQDLAFTMLFVTVAVVSIPSLLRFTPVIVFTGLFFTGWLVVLLTLDRVIARFPRLRRIALLASFEEAVRGLWSRKPRMAAAFGLTAAYWLMLGPAGWLLAREAGIAIPFHQVLVVVIGAIFFSTAVPGLPGAIGTFEFAAVSLLDLWGVPKEPALTFTIVLHLVLGLVPVSFTLVVLPREGLRSIGALREVMGRWRQVRRETEEEP